MFAVLEAYHFLDLFAGLMWVLYSDHRSTLIFSSRLTAPFSPTRGVRQGCSLSPLLDVLFLDPLLRRVVACASVRGFPCQVWDPFLSRCTRTTFTYFLRATAIVRQVLYMFSQYALVSGASLNTSKSKDLRVRNFRGILPFGIRLVIGLTILGVIFDER